MLANPFEKEHKLLVPPTLKIPKAPKKIVTPANTEKMIEEIEKLRKTDGRYLQSKNYEVFLQRLKNSKHTT